MDRVITREAVDLKDFLDAMVLLARADFKERRSRLEVSYDTTRSKYEVTRTRFNIILEGAMEPPMVKAVYEQFPDARIISTSGGAYRESSPVVMVQLLRPVPKEEPSKT
jgi:hypothetical protein